MSGAGLENWPNASQCIRLGRFLEDLAALCTSQRLVLAVEDGELRIVDLERDSVIGIGLDHQLSGRWRHHIDSYNCEGSILDGVWLVENGNGDLVEQQTLPQPVYRQYLTSPERTP